MKHFPNTMQLTSPEPRVERSLTDRAIVPTAISP